MTGGAQICGDRSCTAGDRHVVFPAPDASTSGGALLGPASLRRGATPLVSGLERLTSQALLGSARSTCSALCAVPLTQQLLSLWTDPPGPQLPVAGGCLLVPRPRLQTRGPSCRASPSDSPSPSKKADMLTSSCTFVLSSKFSEPAGEDWRCLLFAVHSDTPTLHPGYSELNCGG